jgi:hypothetical protein
MDIKDLGEPIVAINSSFDNANLAGGPIRNANLCGVYIRNRNIAGLRVDGVLVSDLLAACRKTA